MALLLLAYAAVAVASGLDRAAARNPLLARWVPDGFASASFTSRAVAAFRNQNFARMETFARQAVESAPLEPLNAGLLGAAMLGRGEGQAADRAYRVAGQMGWREPTTQIYWMQVALATGEWDIAAQRADAILRLDPSQARNPQIVAPFEQSGASRAALVERMLEDPPWLETYFDPAPDASAQALAARAAVLDALGEKRRVDCATIEPLITQFARADMVSRAHALWSSDCAGAQGALLRDGNLEAAERRPAVPFGWQLMPSGSLTFRRQAGGIAIANRAAFPRSFARQLLVLEPGAYRLSWRETGARPDDGSRLIPTVGCVPDRGARLTPRREAEGRVSAQFAVDGACEGQWLTLFVEPGGGDTVLADFRLERL